MPGKNDAVCPGPEAMVDLTRYPITDLDTELGRQRVENVGRR